MTLVVQYDREEDLIEIESSYVPHVGETIYLDLDGDDVKCIITHRDFSSITDKGERRLFASLTVERETMEYLLNHIDDIKSDKLRS